jgi:hypothetical protein
MMRFALGRFRRHRRAAEVRAGDTPPDDGRASVESMGNKEHTSRASTMQTFRFSALIAERRPCPSTHQTHGAFAGYVVDHVVPLKRGGADAPSNMQWQTIEAGKAKDK